MSDTLQPPSTRANFPSSLQDFSTASQMDRVPTDTEDTSTEGRDEEGAQLDEEQKEEIQEEGGAKQQWAEDKKEEEELEEMEEGLKRLEESSEWVRSIEEEGGKCVQLEWRQQSEDASTEEWPCCLHSGETLTAISYTSQRIVSSNITKCK